MKQIALLGDSIFDNASYVAKDNSVSDYLYDLISDSAHATLLAVDGDVIADVYSQIDKLPKGITYAFISVGGNDALRKANTLRQSVENVGSAMALFVDLLFDFRRQYADMLSLVKEKVNYVTVCTIHNRVPDYEEAALQTLSMFNEAILEEAFRLKVPVIDLRIACDKAEDYSSISPIEPSELGGKKIACLINRVMREHDFNANCSYIYT